jgi:hydroxymethyl cephem carbamoyltransferase
MKPGHDGALAVIEDGRLLLAVEGEKDSHRRHEVMTPMALLDVARIVDRPPDVLALGGWTKNHHHEYGRFLIGAGYLGTGTPVCRTSRFFGSATRIVSSSHERSHIMMAMGMAPDEGHDVQTVLVWEGNIGTFYLVDSTLRIRKILHVLDAPGARYGMLYALADPTVPETGGGIGWDVPGKLMALAAFGRSQDADAAVRETVDRILTTPVVFPLQKSQFRHSPVFNAGVEAAVTKTAAALLTDRIFEMFARAAEGSLPPGTPLRISGGCGLNCDWNQRWRRHGFFASVFVPPCTNDSGSALGTAIDALWAVTGRHRIEWDVYCGLPFDHDGEPSTQLWSRMRVDFDEVARVLAQGDVVAWVQGRCELGPRALGNRSLLAEPFCESTRDRLNVLKQREAYRPVAPCCRLEDAGRFFGDEFPDPYMLYTRQVRAPHLKAVTHVDGTARLQTVTSSSNPGLYQMLSAFARHTGSGVLCNTSLNFKGRGFINRMSDLANYCEATGIDHMLVDESWYTRRAV